MSLKNLSVKIKIPKLLKEKLQNKKISKIYKRFEENLNIKKNFAVSVSGGPDSLALAFLSKIYSIKKGLKPKFFHVDHKLRKESSNEASNVKKILKKYSINMEILTWKGLKPLKNIQSEARKKRYDLMFSKCDKYKIQDILVGHHQNDLLENFFIRLLRGSGLKGLISLDLKQKIGNKNLLRPLLFEKKEDLIFISKNIFGFYINDPSNNEEKFQRVKIRRLNENLKQDGFDEKKFLKTIKNLKSSNNVISFYVDKNLIQNTFFSNNRKQIIINKEFFNQPEEIVLRSLSEVIKIMGKKYYPVRGKKLEKVIFNYHKSPLFRVTLGGCILEKVNQTVILTKEY